jgi:hypothetical protein
LRALETAGRWTFLGDLATGDHPELLEAYFKARVRERNLALSSHEVYTSGLFDDLVKAVEPSVAFDLVTPASALALPHLVYDLPLQGLPLIPFTDGCREVRPSALESGRHVRGPTRPRHLGQQHQRQIE